jgi:predicted CXXCH cytochrome family protein
LSSALLLLVTLAPSASAQPRATVSENRRDCATCHLEWDTDFDRPGAVLLIDRPPSAVAGTESNCLGCHDGSVGDSRKSVWLEHGHRVGMKPSDKVKVPPGLPLDDGKIACRTCHTAHEGPAAEVASDTIFLRMENDRSQLCQACHVDQGGQGKGLEHGSHPLLPMGFELPRKLADAGGHAGPKHDEVTCQSCHGAHGTVDEKLLLMGTNNSQLCLACHDKIKPGQFSSDRAHEHPQNPPLSSDAMRKAIKDLGTKTGSNDTLICLSCHRLHDGKAGRNMLADTLTDSALCIRCHPNRQELTGSLHDLRKSAPKEKNRLGQTPEQSGQCGACHSFHNYAREREVAKGDPGGVCVTCHQTGRVAEKIGGTHFDHPATIDPSDPSKLPKGARLGGAAPVLLTDPAHADRADLLCVTCHNPHEVKRGRFLRDAPDQICATCHTNESSTLAGQHDFTKHSEGSEGPELKNGRGLGAADTGKCGFCHSVHDAKGRVMWAGTNQAPKNPNALCVECHNPDGMAKAHPAAKFSHPDGPSSSSIKRPADPPSAPLPLFDANGHPSKEGFVACSSCHDPHANSEKSPLMLRVQGSTSTLCMTCHKEQAALVKSTHDPRSNPKAWPAEAQKRGQDLCMTCHRAHGNDPDQRTWAVTPKVTPTGTVADGVCMACHAQNSWPAPTGAVSKGQMLHPRTIPPKMMDDPAVHILPIADGAKSHQQDTIACKTCHNPHARPGTPSLLRTPDQGGRADPAGVCYTCHTETKVLQTSMHALDLLARNGKVPNTDVKADISCRPCHSAHATESRGGSERRMLWTAKMGEGTDLTEKHCLGCHDNTTARRPALTQHPNVVFEIVAHAGQSTTRPAPLPDNKITCSTCHVPHGRELDLSPKSKEQRAAAKPMLRPDAQATVCATCHGADGERLLLYWHQPEKLRQIPKITKPTSKPG